jgi:hypothetical protein
MSDRMIPDWRLALLLVSLSTLSACSMVLPKGFPGGANPPVAPFVLEEQEVRALFAELPRLAVLGAEEARQEQAAASALVARAPGEAARLRLALVLTLGVGGRNEARLQALLDEADARSATSDSPRGQLWVMLQRVNGERLRAQHEAQVRGEARLEARLHESELRVREAQAHADELQKKLDALKSVERTLNKRPIRPEKTPP